jgi:excisionase family DNA binding protein
MNEPFLTASEVAHLLKVNVETVYTLIRTAGLPAAKVGSQWRFVEREARHWVHARTQDTRRPPLTRGGPGSAPLPQEGGSHGRA